MKGIVGLLVSLPPPTIFRVIVLALQIFSDGLCRFFRPGLRRRRRGRLNTAGLLRAQYSKSLSNINNVFNRTRIFQLNLFH